MIYSSNQFFSSTEFKGGLKGYSLTTFRPPLGQNYFSTHHSYNIHIPVPTFKVPLGLGHPSLFALVFWSKVCKKVEGDREKIQNFHFFIISRDQYDHFQF